MFRYILSSLIYFILTITACSATPPIAATPSVDFKNSIYRFVDSFGQGEITLSDGKYEKETELGSEHISFVTRAHGEIVPLRDVEVILLAQNAGGSGIFYRLGVYRFEDGVLVEEAYMWLGDRVIIHHLGVEDGQIVLVMTRHGAEDPLCCPSEVVIQKIFEDDGLLTVTSEEIIGTTIRP
ncbi:MAG: hypothetical protein PVF83_03525 [Anaerolineales bacterium]|jgi:hypothetical protein